MTEAPQISDLKEWVLTIAGYMRRNETPPVNYYISFTQDPKITSRLIALINDIVEGSTGKLSEEEDLYYSACVFAIDIFISQLQMADETGNRQAEKVLDQLMDSLATAILAGKHTVSFWMPILNSFYEMHIKLSPKLQHAYLALAEQEDLEQASDETSAHAIGNLIQELSHLSVFEVAEYLFAQSYAMPAEFFTGLVPDLYSIEEGQEVGLLMLLHPSFEVRDLVVHELDTLLPHVKLTSIELTRLQSIKQWYPSQYHDYFDRWIKDQRKQGVVFHIPEEKKSKLRLQASEVDGGGAQGIFICLNQPPHYRLGSLLFKQGVGLKDAWITSIVDKAGVEQYFNEAFDDHVTLKSVDLEYIKMMANHFLTLTLASNEVPALHLLELQEALGFQFIPKPLDIATVIDDLAVQITPFTQEVVEKSFKRSARWSKNKRFTESWYLETADIDRLVNQYCSLVDGIKVCRLEEAVDAVFEEDFEHHRERWMFHFLWLSLWAKAKARKNEMLWIDSFFIAHAIHSGTTLREIPIMHEIAMQTVINSIETMQDRRTHLS